MKILSLSTDQELNALREFALRAAGHEITVVNTEKDALAAARAEASHDAILLCHKLPSSTARQIVRLLRENQPNATVVFISHLYGEWPDVEADRYIVGADGPEALHRVLQEVTGAATANA